MMKTNRLTTALALAMGAFALGAAQANEQGLRPLPEDVATQTDEMSEDTLPFPEGAMQDAGPAPEIVQDAQPVPDEPAQENGDVSPNDDFASDTAEPLTDEVSEAAVAIEPAPAAPADQPAGSLSSPQTLEQAMQTRFASGDENGNGVLTQAELDALDDDDLVFADIDGDADGSITREEWSAQLSTQVASADNDE